MSPGHKFECIANIAVLLLVAHSFHTSMRFNTFRRRLFMICTMALIISEVVILREDFKGFGKENSLNIIRKCDLVIEFARAILNYGKQVRSVERHIASFSDTFMTIKYGNDYKTPWDMISSFVLLDMMIGFDTFHPDTIILFLSTLNSLLEITAIITLSRLGYNPNPRILFFSVIRSADFLYESVFEFDFEVLRVLRGTQIFMFAGYGLTHEQ